MPVRARIVDGPIRFTVPPVGMIGPGIFAGIKAVLGRVHQAREGPFAGHPPIGRDGEVFVLIARVLAERPLSEGSADQHEGGESEDQRNTQADQVAYHYVNPKMPHLLSQRWAL